MTIRGLLRARLQIALVSEAVPCEEATFWDAANGTTIRFREKRDEATSCRNAGAMPIAVFQETVDRALA